MQTSFYTLRDATYLTDFMTHIFVYLYLFTTFDVATVDCIKNVNEKRDSTSQML